MGNALFKRAIQIARDVRVTIALLGRGSELVMIHKCSYFSKTCSPFLTASRTMFDISGRINQPGGLSPLKNIALACEPLIKLSLSLSSLGDLPFSCTYLFSFLE